MIKQNKSISKKATPKQILYLELVPFLLAFILYVNSIPNNYTLDDNLVITNNINVQAGIKGMEKIVTTNLYGGTQQGFNDGVYRPLVPLTFAAEVELFGNNPHMSHFINVLLYALIGLFLFKLLQHLFNNYHIIFPLLVTILFIAHPVHTEAVANIKGRDELLTFLSFLLCSYFFVKYTHQQTIKNIILALFFYCLSFLSKEIAITFVVIIPAMLYFFTNAGKKQLLSSTVLLIFCSIILLLWRHHVISSLPTPIDKGIVSALNNSVVSTDVISKRIATGIYIQLLYIIKLIFPYPLLHDYSYNQISVVDFFSHKTFLSLAVLIMLLIIFFKYIKQKHFIAFAIFFYFITLLPVSNLLLYIGATFAERFLFTPSLGFCIILAWLITIFFSIPISKTKCKLLEIIIENKGFTTTCTIVLIIYSVITISRADDWKDDFTLFSKDIKYLDHSARAHYNYGSALLKNNITNDATLYRTAINELNKAVTIYPEYLDAHNNLGNAYKAAGLIDSAIWAYNRLININSQYSKAYFNIGITYLAKNDYINAANNFKAFIELNNTMPIAYYYLGMSIGYLGKFDEALIYLKKYEDFEPQNIANLLLIGKAYGNLGNNMNALKYFNKVLQIEPNNIDALINAGITYGLLKQYNEAIKIFKKAQKLEPNNTNIVNQLIVTYQLLGETRKADSLRNYIIK